MKDAFDGSSENVVDIFGIAAQLADGETLVDENKGAGCRARLLL